MKKAVLHWSGGKDAAFCLYMLRNSKQVKIEKLLTTISEPYNRISMHGVRSELLDKQVESLGIPLEKIALTEMPSMDDYETALKNKLIELKMKGLNVSVFGDIFLEDIKSYRERILSEINVGLVFPLWHIHTTKLSKEFITAGFKAKVVCVDARYLDKDFAGLDYNMDFINALPKNLDPCGENGEFHTFVYAGPGFQKPVDFMPGEKVYREYKMAAGSIPVSGFWFCDLIPNK
ncbi:MAG: diphthine--ammonia ligase [Bacteroidales bacterium]